MRVSLIAVAWLAFSSICVGQNLLRWDAWQETGSRRGFSTVTQRYVGISLSGTYSGVGVTQTVRIPSDGLYQFHYFGSGFETPLGEWIFTSLQNPVQRLPLHTDKQQIARTFFLRAGDMKVQFQLHYCQGCYPGTWSMDQPVLRPVFSPTVQLTMREFSGPGPDWVNFRSGASAILYALRRTSSPVRIPGFAHGLELDMTSPSGVLAIATSGSGQIDFQVPVWDVTVGPFFVQAVRIGANPAFGSRLFIEEMVFAPRR